MHLLLSLALSSLLVAIILRAGQKSNGAAFLTAAGSVVVALFNCQSPLFIVNTLLLAIVLFGCWVAGAERRKVIQASIIATALAYLLISYFIIDGLRRHGPEPGREPLVSLEPRLAYETSTPRSAVVLPPETRAELLLLEGQLGRDELPEAERLRELHQNYVMQFINSPGFGVVRILGRNANSAFGTVGASIGSTIGPSAPATSGGAVPLPRDYEEPGLFDKFTAAWPGLKDRVPPQIAFLRMNRYAVIDFASRDRYGYVRDRQHVAGFKPHAMRRTPRLEESTWQLARIELVSLLKHPEPVAYVSEHLPRMDSASRAPVRPLDELEKAMLGTLQSGADVDVRLAEDRLRMLGAIRAAEQCLQCHEVQRGALLGAFTYKMKSEPR